MEKSSEITVQTCHKLFYIVTLCVGTSGFQGTQKIVCPCIVFYQNSRLLTLPC